MIATSATAGSTLRRGTAGALAVAFLLTLTPPQSATAATWPSSTSKSAPVYECVTAGTSYCTKAVRTVAAGTKLRMVCWTDARAEAGFTHRRWFYAKFSNGVEGFIKAELVKSQTAVKSCSDKAGGAGIQAVIASQWALGHMFRAAASSTVPNQLTPTTAETKRLNAVWGLSLNWTRGNWSGDCISFVALGWDAAGKKIPLRNARQVYDHYKAAGRIKTAGTPPRGALIFWNATASNGINYGHVAISLGNGRMVGTKGWDSKTEPLKLEPVRSGSLGWAMP